MSAVGSFSTQAGFEISSQLGSTINTFQQIQRLKLLSYNLQVGIDSHSYGDYVTQSWRHLLPDSKRNNNLRNAADWLADYDIVALQEVDSGSLRSQYINQVAYLAHRGGFAHFHQQQNRRLAGFAAHSNGLLSKYPSSHVVHHKLPGKIPGRGALQVNFEANGQQILILSVHLALSATARRLQLHYIANLLMGVEYFVIMGDMNCSSLKVSDEFHKQGIEVKQGNPHAPTFPRWKPKHTFDQIWVSQSLNIIKSEVLDLGVSDHLPISMEVEIPNRLSNTAIPSYYIN